MPNVRSYREVALALRVSGTSYREIAATLNRCGYRTPRAKPWTTQSVYELLRKELALGRQATGATLSVRSAARDAMRQMRAMAVSKLQSTA